MGTFVGLFCCLDGRLVYSSQKKATSTTTKNKQTKQFQLHLVVWCMIMPLVAKKKRQQKTILNNPQQIEYGIPKTKQTPQTNG